MIIGMRMGVVFIIEFFLIQSTSRDFDLGFIITKDFEEDGAVSVQDFVDIYGGSVGDSAQLPVIFTFASYGTENLVTSSHDGGATDFAFSFHSEVFWF